MSEYDLQAAQASLQTQQLAGAIKAYAPTKAEHTRKAELARELIGNAVDALRSLDGPIHGRSPAADALKAIDDLLAAVGILRAVR